MGAHVSQDPPGGNDVPGTPPWERPRRWTQRRLESERVDDLLARLGEPDHDDPRNRRRRRAHDANDAQAVDASSLLASHGYQVDTPQTAANAHHDDSESEASAADAPSLTPPVAEEPQAVEPEAVEEPEALRTHEPMEATDIISAVIDDDESRDVEAEVTAVRSLPTEPTKNETAKDASADNNKNDKNDKANGHPVRSSLHWTARSVIALVSVGLLLATAVYWRSFTRFEQSLADNEIPGVVTDDTHVAAPTKVPDPAAPAARYAPENWLLMGSDTRAGAGNAEFDDPDKPMDSAQSDTMMLAHLSADRKQISILSLPRDLRIPAPKDCQGWNYKTGELTDKIWPVDEGERWLLTNTYAVGGPQCTVRAIQKFSGIKIDRVVIIDFAGFKSMVDALGGVTIDVCRPIDDVELGVITELTGPQHMDGDQVLSVVRARKVKGDTESELARVRRQQVVLSTILRKVTSAGTLLNPNELDRFLQAFAHATNTSNVTMSTLLDLAHSLGALSADTVTFYTLPTKPDGQHLAMIDELAQPMFSALINDERMPAPGGSPAPAPAGTTSEPSPSQSPTISASPTPTQPAAAPVPAPAPAPEPIRLTVAPGDVKLQVENATGRKGVAGQTQEKLKARGFAVNQPDLLVVQGKVTAGISVDYAPGQIAAAFTVAAAFPGAKLQEANDLGTWQVRVVLGSDYDGAVAAAPKVGDDVPAALVPASMIPAAQQPAAAVPPSAEQSPAPAPTPTQPPATAEINPTDFRMINAEDRQCV